jgi:hypothetical protein
MAETDLISRQAALNAIDTWDKFGCDPDGKLVSYDDDNHYVPYVHYDDMIHVIKHLPSAQPEPQWIQCSERLPEARRSVILSTKNWTGEGCYWETTAHHVVWKGYRWNATYWDGEVIAWMPLPEPYKEGADE